MVQIQHKQEDLIKSIVLKSAVFKQEFKEFNHSYKEEFIQSICNKSGVFVKEFREQSDPYAREEFIMSMCSAKFEKVDQEKEFEIYNKTI